MTQWPITNLFLQPLRDCCTKGRQIGFLMRTFWQRLKRLLPKSSLRYMAVRGLLVRQGLQVRQVQRGLLDLQAQMGLLASQVQLALQVAQAQLDQLGLPDRQVQQAEQARLALQVQRDQLALRVQQARRG